MQCQLAEAAVCGLFQSATALFAQSKPITTPWRGAGAPPYVGRDLGVLPCPPRLRHNQFPIRFFFKYAAMSSCVAIQTPGLDFM
jgi:hypothetical protein